LRGVVGGVVNKVIGAFLLGLFGVSPIGSLVGLVGAGIAEVADKSLRRLLERLGIAKNETIECLRNIVNAAKEASQYIDDEGLRGVVEEVAKKWGWNVDTFRRFVKTAAGKSVTEDEVREMIEGALKRIEEELNKVKTEVKGLLVDAKVFFIDDVENGLLYGNFIVEGGVPKIKTQLGTAKNEPATDLVDTGKFHEIAEDVLSRLARDGRVVLTGPRGIGKSTLATYVAWRSLLGGLGKVVLDKSMDAVIRVDSLNPGDALELNNLIKTTGRRFIVIYDPSPIKAYYKPEAMQRARYNIKGIRETLKELIESVKNTLRELMEVRNAWVVIILPRELYDEVSKSKELRNILNEIRSYIIDVDLKNEGFLREVIKKYSGCDNVSDGLVKVVMGFDSYTLLAKYVGIWLRERGCKVDDVDETLRESAGEPKLFFAHYIWGTILGKKMDLAKRVSVPLILHAAFGPIPEGITYITKAGNEGGAWKLIDRNELAESKLEDLREDDLEPIAKWLSTLHEDLIEETLEELVGLRGEGARKQYIGHGFEDFIKALDWGYEKALEEVRGLGREVKPEEVVTNLLTLTGERLKHALKLYTNCWKRTALIIGCALAGHDSLPRFDIPLPIVIRAGSPPKSLREDIAESLGDALGGCGVDDYLLVGDKIPPLIMNLIKNHARALAEAFVDKYNEAINEVGRVRDTARGRSIYGDEGVYGLGLASIIAKAAELGRPIKPSDVDAALRIVFAAFISPDYVKPVLRVLEPLRNKALHRYLELQVSSLVDAMDNYISQLSRYGREDVVDKIFDLLNELGRLSPNLGVIARARVLARALENENVRLLIERRLGINVVDKADEVLEELSKLKEKVQELMSDEVFVSYVESKELMKDEGVMGYVEFKPVKAVEGAVKRTILKETFPLKHKLAHYKFRNDDLDDAARLFNEMAEEDRKIGIYENYLANSNWALRAEAINGSLVGDELVKKFQQLYEEAFNEKHFENTAWYLSTASLILGGYLVSLALAGDHETISKLLEKHLWVLNANKQVSVLTRLMLNALLGHRVGLSSELEGRLSVNPEELIYAFGSDMHSEFRPALRIALEIAKPEDGAVMCVLIKDSTKGVRVVCGDSAIDWLRWGLVDGFRESLIERFGQLKEFGVNADKLLDEFMELVNGLDGKSLVQLIAPRGSMARLALMLRALINGDERLAKAHALYGAVGVSEKLPTRLFLEAYRACRDLGSEGCDLKNDKFRRAIVGLFFYHV